MPKSSLSPLYTKVQQLEQDLQDVLMAVKELEKKVLDQKATTVRPSMAQKATTKSTPAKKT